MKDCLFCKIVRQEISSYKIYEDDLILAFLDISQCTVGHTLVIPKKHFDNYLVCDTKTLMHLSAVSQKLANLLKEKLHFTGINILANTGKTAGQSVDHFHIHLIPRYNQSDQFDIHQNSTPVDKEYLNTIHLKITDKL